MRKAEREHFDGVFTEWNVRARPSCSVTKITERRLWLFNVRICINCTILKIVGEYIFINKHIL